MKITPFRVFVAVMLIIIAVSLTMAVVTSTKG
jgi:hypothetical protein